MPLAHDPGHAQVDFGEAKVVVAGVERKAHFFAMDLPQCASSAVFRPGKRARWSACRSVSSSSHQSTNGESSLTAALISSKREFFYSIKGFVPGMLKLLRSYHATAPDVG